MDGKNLMNPHKLNSTAPTITFFLWLRLILVSNPMVKISLIKWSQCVRIGLSVGSKKSKSTREDTTKRRATQNTRRSRVCVWGRWDPPIRRDRCVWFISHSCIGRHRNQLPGVLSLSNTVKASPSLTSLPGYFKLYKTFIC